MDKVKYLAEVLNGREYRNELSNEDIAYAMDVGLVIVYGASDDLMEFMGAIHDEIDCYNGGIAYLDKNGLWSSKCTDEDCPYAKKEMLKCKTIEAIWDDGEYSWIYKTLIPHVDFDILENGEKYCRGIVFDIRELSN